MKGFKIDITIISVCFDGFKIAITSVSKLFKIIVVPNKKVGIAANFVNLAQVLLINMYALILINLCRLR